MAASPPDPDEFARLLRHLLDDREMTQAELGDLIGVRPQMVGKYLKGSTPGPKRARLIDDALAADGAIMASLDYQPGRGDLRAEVAELRQDVDALWATVAEMQMSSGLHTAADSGQRVAKGKTVKRPTGARSDD